MWVPTTFAELLDERIVFIENYIRAVNNRPVNNESDNSVLISDFTKALIDIKELKRLLALVTENPDHEDKGIFKKYAMKFLGDLGMRLEDEKKEYMPLSNRMYNDKLYAAFNKIFNDVRDM